MAIYLLLLLVISLQSTNSLTDFTLSCQRGYHISGIKRLNSPHQAHTAGSLSIECQSIVENDLDSVSNVFRI